MLSVSSTTTLAILTAVELGSAAPDGDPTRLVAAKATLTALVGALLLAARLTKLGFVASFISVPVLTGFKAGIGLVILLDQAPKLLGLHVAKQSFVSDLASLVQHLPQTSLPTLAVAGTTIVVLVCFEWLKPHSPAPLITVAAAIAASWPLDLGALGVSTVGTIPRGLPSLNPARSNPDSGVWKNTRNCVRPHSFLDYRPPAPATVPALASRLPLVTAMQ